MTRCFRTLSLLAAGAACLLADTTFNQTTKFTGGSMVEMMHRMAANPMMSRLGGGGMRTAFQDQKFTVYVKGNKMARIGELTSTLYDLDAGTMTIINNQRQTYTTETFDQMREQMQQMQSRSNHGNAGGNVQFDVKVDQTGQTRTIDGQTATETLITMTAQQQAQQGGTMVVKSDVWLVPASSSTQELRDFYKRLSTKFAEAFSSPGMGPAGSGIAAAMAETMKLNGFPVVNDVSVSGVAGMGAMAGGGDSSGGPLLVMETVSGGFAPGPVDDSHFTIPAGFKQEQQKHGGR